MTDDFETRLTQVLQDKASELPSGAGDLFTVANYHPRRFVTRRRAGIGAFTIAVIVTIALVLVLGGALWHAHSGQVPNNVNACSSFDAAYLKASANFEESIENFQQAVRLGLGDTEDPRIMAAASVLQHSIESENASTVTAELQYALACQAVGLGPNQKR